LPKERTKEALALSGLFVKMFLKHFLTLHPCRNCKHRLSNSALLAVAESLSFDCTILTKRVYPKDIFVLIVNMMLFFNFPFIETYYK